ncbi:4'-phosphopantetheinyl transferase family protein [Deefgea rivuli]|uniref:4'-phosphopantetheinyl transferase family protein n=1 Tax=Deefgea rivuli TaxID=400948 RepID=UPI000685AA7D|nr:4'-phosphopantetheinyl transferase superfamily protein [Deefgea rivuli]
MLVSRFAVSPIAAEDLLAPTLADLDFPQQQRFAAMQNPQRRAQFLSARHLAQQLLQLNHCVPTLTQHENGRPSAPAWPFADGLSWTHGAAYCAAALGQGRVGIDLEIIRPRKQLQAIATSYFDPRETAWLAGLPEAEQLRAFYILWVAKEALLKALGTGLVGGLQRFVLLKTATGWCCESPDSCTWSLQVWEVAPNVLLALASDVPQAWQAVCDTQAWQTIIKI